MTHLPQHYLKTGGDPRTLADYTALRDELNKLTHPARPDVNWRYAEKLCLALFEHNGVELQTAAWYTQIRTHLAGVYGLNEGLAILDALVTHQWHAVWPQPVHARMEILSGLSQRLQQIMRMSTLSYADLSPLYQAEQHLARLGEALQRLELKHLSRMDELRHQLHNAAVRLEHSDVGDNTQNEDAGRRLSPFDTPALPPSSSESKQRLSSANGQRWVYVAYQEPEPKVAVVITPPIPARPWRAFMAGVMVALVMMCLGGWGYLRFTQDPLRDSLMASVAPLPVTLPRDQLELLVQQTPSWINNNNDYATQTQARLAALADLPPDWSAAYAARLLHQTQQLWPNTPHTLALVHDWRQQLDARAMPAASLEGWHQGMTQLQQLANQLNRLDEKRGKYLTVSELKTIVYSSMQAFNQHPPVEEQLRQLQSGDSALVQMEIERHLSQLLNRYALIRYR
ncbi:VasL domain-containing protein [Acerihabitans sp. TG2]|uniref:VasL domain-containing protein n=1 Tax=Acerihabitans sp. TG2 TaxID=3096008 RepID=UPI002B226F2E|nr:VasL domain-containing protein [Acerihabitans sp. TG2]MEA9393108.1 VasL domain-containing protein [Acerihabitans sp. TG2]